MRILRRLLRKYRQQQKIDKHLSDLFCLLCVSIFLLSPSYFSPSVLVSFFHILLHWLILCCFVLLYLLVSLSPSLLFLSLLCSPLHSSPLLQDMMNLLYMHQRTLSGKKSHWTSSSEDERRASWSWSIRCQGETVREMGSSPVCLPSSLFCLKSLRDRSQRVHHLVACGRGHLCILAAPKKHMVDCLAAVTTLTAGLGTIRLLWSGELRCGQSNR